MTIRYTLLVALAVALFAIAVARPCEAGTTHVYYIAADEVRWDYVPGGIDGRTGKPLDFLGYFAGPDGKIVARPESTAYTKCLYRAYTDATFRTFAPTAPRWQHLGMLGPLIRASVGDTIKVFYRNNCSFPNSIHAHGVFYTKANEGAPYAGSNSLGDAVPPGGEFTYVWQVPQRAGPGPNDPNSVLWMYHSHTSEYRDANSGLMGPIVITARGQAKADGTPDGVDREFVLWWAQIHEEDSWYVDRNLPTVTTDHAIPRPLTEQSATVTYPYYVTFSINGYSFSSIPSAYLTMRRGEHVRWYLMAGQQDFDFHTPHWHGNTVTIDGMRSDVAFMGAMQMVVADMIPDDAGTWLLHCHVAFHNELGMNALYRVVP